MERKKFFFQNKIKFLKIKVSVKLSVFEFDYFYFLPGM